MILTVGRSVPLTRHVPQGVSSPIWQDTSHNQAVKMIVRVM